MYEIIIEDKAREKSGSLMMDFGRYSVGSDVSSDIVLMDDSVHSAHAELVFEEKSWYVVPFKSLIFCKSSGDDNDEEYEPDILTENEKFSVSKTILIGDYCLIINPVTQQTSASPVELDASLEDDLEIQDTDLPHEDEIANEKEVNGDNVSADNDSIILSQPYSINQKARLIIRKNPDLAIATVAAIAMIFGGGVWQLLALPSMNKQFREMSFVAQASALNPKENHKVERGVGNFSTRPKLRLVRENLDKDTIKKILIEAGANYIDYKSQDYSSIINVYNSDITKKNALLDASLKLLPNKEVRIFNDTSLKQSLLSYIETHAPFAKVERVTKGKAYILLKYENRKEKNTIVDKIREEIPSIRDVIVKISTRINKDIKYNVTSIWLGDEPYIQIGSNVYHENSVLPDDKKLVSIDRAYAIIDDGENFIKINYGEKND